MRGGRSKIRATAPAAGSSRPRPLGWQRPDSARSRSPRPRVRRSGAEASGQAARDGGCRAMAGDGMTRSLLRAPFNPERHWIAHAIRDQRGRGSQATRSSRRRWAGTFSPLVPGPSLLGRAAMRSGAPTGAHELHLGLALSRCRCAWRPLGGQRGMAAAVCRGGGHGRPRLRPARHRRRGLAIGIVAFAVTGVAWRWARAIGRARSSSWRACRSRTAARAPQLHAFFADALHAVPPRRALRPPRRSCWWTATGSRTSATRYGQTPAADAGGRGRTILSTPRRHCRARCGARSSLIVPGRPTRGPGGLKRVHCAPVRVRVEGARRRGECIHDLRGVADFHSSADDLGEPSCCGRPTRRCAGRKAEGRDRVSLHIRRPLGRRADSGPTPLSAAPTSRARTSVRAASRRRQPDLTLGRSAGRRPARTGPKTGQPAVERKQSAAHATGSPAPSTGSAASARSRCSSRSPQGRGMHGERRGDGP